MEDEIEESSSLGGLEQFGITPPDGSPQDHPLEIVESISLKTEYSIINKPKLELPGYLDDDDPSAQFDRVDSGEVTPVVMADEAPMLNDPTYSQIRVLVRNLPHDCKLKSLLEDVVGIEVKHIEFAAESAIVELFSQADLDYLLSQSPYTYKKQQLEFTTAESVFVPAVSQTISMDDPPAPYQNEDAPNIHDYNGIKIFLDSKSSLPAELEMVKPVLSLQFKNDPYFLDVSECSMNADHEIIVQFTQEDGVSKVLANPPSSLLGATIEVCGISLKDDDEAPQSPSFLIIEDLPLSDIPDHCMMKECLISLFDNKGYKGAEVVIEDSLAYVWFKSSNAAVIQSIVENPPDNSTFLGCPVTFRAGYEAASNGSSPEFNSGIVLVKNLPKDCSRFKQFLVVYLTNVLNGTAPTHCDINGSEAAVKFEDKQAALALIQNPPESPFISQRLTFESLSYYNFSSSDEISIQSQQNESKTPAVSLRPQPKPRPRKIQCSSVLVTNVPDSCEKPTLQMYLEALTHPITCEKLILKSPKAVVYFSKAIDFSKLKSAMSAEKFEGKFLLVPEQLPPSLSVLITMRQSTQRINDYTMIYYCRRFGLNPKIEVKKEDVEFVATFQSKKECVDFVKADHSTASIGDLVVTPYHPIVASLEEHDAPPPIPPRPGQDDVPPLPPPRLRTQTISRPPVEEVMYSVPPVVEEVSVPLGKYLFQTQTKLNKRLEKVYAEARVESSSIEIRPSPITRANTVPDWGDKVLKIFQDHKNGFVQKNIEVEEKYINKVIGYLQHEGNHLEDCPDYAAAPMHGNYVQLSGSKASIEKVEILIRNFLESEVEKSREFKREHHEIEYLLKLGADIFKSMNPPVTYKRIEAKPDVLIIKGVQVSLDKFEKAADEKLIKMHCEFISLTKSVYRLLSNPQGKAKLAKSINADDIMYVFIPCTSGEFSHQACIMSSKKYLVANAKEAFESLCKEESILIPQEKKGILSSKEWEVKLADLKKKNFVSIRTKDSNESVQITVTGDKNDVWKVSEEIKTFRETQHESTAEVIFENPVWTVISSHSAMKIKEVKNRAKDQKVAFEVQEGSSNDAVVIITLKGAVKSVESIKTMLSLMAAEVQQKDVSFESKPGLENVVNKGAIDVKRNDLLKTHDDVEIRYNLLTDDDTAADTTCFKKTHPNRLFKAQSSTGVTINLYEGDYTQLGRDALVVFVSDDPSLDEVLQPHMTEGGEELQSHATHLAQSSSNWVAPLVHRAKLKAPRCNGLYYAVLPLYSMVGKTKAATALEAALKEVLDVSARSNDYDLVFSPLTAAPLNYPYHVIASALVASFSICGMSSSDLTISLFTWEMSPLVESFSQVLQNQHGFSITKKERMMTLSLSVAASVSTGTRQSFQNIDLKSLKKSVEIVDGSIFDQKADVYINSTNSNMALSSGGVLSNLFKKKCGQPLLDEADEYIKKNGKLKNTDVAVTGANGLNAKKIYHVSLPTSSKTSTQYIDIFRQTVENIFKTAMKEGHKSIAIPCLGTANLGYSSQLSASVLLEAAVSFHKAHPGAISKFIFVAFRPVDKKAFDEEFEKLTNPAAERSVRVTPVTSSKTSGTTMGQLKLEVLNGDIVKETTNVIVNSTSPDMQVNANQISKAVFAAGGDKLKEACSKLTSNGQSLSKGNVLATTGGNLKCTKVYHVHIPSKTTAATPPTDSDIQTPMTSCLTMAEADKHESISFPAFNLGAGNYTCEQSGMLMFQCIEKFLRRSPKHLKSIRVVIFDKKLYDEFCGYFRKHFSDATSNAVFLEQMPPSSISARLASARKRDVKLPTAPRPQKLVCKKSSIVFHIYSLKPESGTLVENKLKTFFEETFVKAEVPLNKAADIFHSMHRTEIYRKAQMEDVEVQFQEDTKSFVLYGEKHAVQSVESVIGKIIIDCLSMADEVQKYEWLYEEEGSDWIAYPDDVMKNIEVAYKKQLRSFEICIDDINATIDFEAMEEREEIANSKRKILRREKAMGIAANLPSEWCSQPCEANGKEEVVHFEPIDPSSNEYLTATDLFIKTLGTTKYSIVSVDRIQNPGEYTRYMALKQSWESTHGQGKVTEKEVFHGTKLDSILPICSQGFNRNFAATANAAYFGTGVYFALNASYSVQDKYSPVDDKGLKNILVCSLVVGECIKGNPKMIVPPNLPNDNQRTYDTLVENEANPTIFVAVKDSQAYPKYWIKFKLT